MGEELVKIPISKEEQMSQIIKERNKLVKLNEKITSLNKDLKYDGESVDQETAMTSLITTNRMVKVGNRRIKELKCKVTYDYPWWEP